MSFYFREKPRFGEKLRGKSGDELLQEMKQQFDEESKTFFEPTARTSRDPFERHAGFSRGFPFDDDGFGRRSDIRAHLDDLAARHPEFADHLLGPPWGDVPFHGTLRNRRRGSGSGGSGASSYQGHPDEDARSQASGSSAASAASGASGVSSHGEPEVNQRERHSQNFEQEGKRRNQIPQYGLRNTVDIGQHRHNMENSDKGMRGQRSMSAPPENRQSTAQQQQEQQAQQPQGQRFVSRVDITPQHNQPQKGQQQPKSQPQPQQQQHHQPQQQQGSNVRHIPIFCEGRDEPVIPRNVEEQHFRREPSPTQFHTMPQFDRLPSFGQHFTGRPKHQWSTLFQDPFFQPQNSFDVPTRRQQQSPNYQQPRQHQYAEKTRPESQQQHYEQPRQQQNYEQPRQQQNYEQPRQQQPQPHQQQPREQQQQQQQDSPKPKQIVPKDPLERVALVQTEVDSLAEQVKRYTGNSRQDKEYIYLDEMLTRELIKLDDIETEGRDNVRQARKNAIKTIQDTISLLESKTAAPHQQSQENQENQTCNNIEETNETVSMDVDHPKQEERTQTNEPIPLPPGPSSPTKNCSESNGTGVQPEVVANNAGNDQSTNPPSVEHTSQQENSQTSNESMDTTAAEKVESVPMDTEPQKPEIIDNQSDTATQANESENKGTENVSLEIKEELQRQQQQLSPEQQTPLEEKMEVDSVTKKSPKVGKKGKKARKQPPVSEEPIPLPPPGSTETSAK